MLVITRKIGESMRIFDDIHITVLGIQGNQIRLGFDAPQHVPVHREEIYLRIQQGVEYTPSENPRIALSGVHKTRPH